MSPHALLGARVDAEAFADAWRGEYEGAMASVRAGHIAYGKLDRLHRRNLDFVLGRFGLDPDEAMRRDLNLA
jgi:2-haloacid dehalogenase